MTCDRCAGCVVRECIHRGGPWWWRCLNCGDRIDGTILHQRAEQAAALVMQREAEQCNLKEWSDWFARMPCKSAVTHVGETL